MEVQVNTGFLMPNTRKESDSHADYTGTWTDADGVEFYLSAWKNVSKKSGSSYLKIKLGKMKGAAQAYQPAQPAKQPVRFTGQQPAGKGRFDDMDDSIPF